MIEKQRVEDDVAEGQWLDRVLDFALPSGDATGKQERWHVFLMVELMVGSMVVLMVGLRKLERRWM